MNGQRAVLRVATWPAKLLMLVVASLLGSQLYVLPLWRTSVISERAAVITSLMVMAIGTALGLLVLAWSSRKEQKRSK